MKQLLSVLFLFAFGLSSCSSSSSTGTNNNSTSTNKTTGTFGGKSVGLNCIAIKSSGGGQTAIAVSSVLDASKQTFGLGLSNITSNGTYDIGTVTGSGSNVQSIDLQYSYTDANGNNVVYEGKLSKNIKVGSVTFTDLSSSVKGQLNAILPLISGPATADTQIVITNCNIDVALN